jgi:hypothetical protein
MLEPEFFTVFDAWFNADVINLSDSQEVEHTARICAADLKNKIHDLENLIDHLTILLEIWEPKAMMEFVNATDADWLHDAETEQILKKILRIIIAELKESR